MSVSNYDPSNLDDFGNFKGDITLLQLMYMSPISSSVTWKDGRVNRLNLGRLGLSKVPKSVFKLTALESLNLHSNPQLTSLPAEIGQLTNLTSLSLRNSALTSLPAEIGKLTKLTSLSLPWKTLTSIPAELNELIVVPTTIDQNLQYSYGLLQGRLSISGDNITSLPTGIGLLTNLTSLNLRYNTGLTSLPAEIGELTALVSLDLSYNIRLTSLPSEMGNLTNLTELNLISCHNLVVDLAVLFGRRRGSITVNKNKSPSVTN